MYSKFKFEIKIKCDVFSHKSFIEVQWTVIRTGEVLETLNMNLKKCYCSIYFLKPADQLVNNLRFLE